MTVFYLLLKTEGENYVVNTFESIRENVISFFDNNDWVKWIHEGTNPARTQMEKELNLVYGAISNHCAKCLNLNGCCFPRSKAPQHPLHPKCHCWLMPISNIQFEANCDLRKFEEYAFVHRTKNDKKGLFENLGYGKIDSQKLIDEYCRQAKEKYANGNFILHELKDHGQIINIAITLPNKKDGGEVTLKSGWMVYPDGKIKLTTVFVGRVK